MIRRKAIRKIDTNRTYYLNETTHYYDLRIERYMRELQAQGWQFYVANQTHGWCCASTKQIIIPVFATGGKNRSFNTWYLAHEMAHAYDMCKSNHGAPFMAQLMRICPAEYQHHEYGYKPQLAMAAGLHIPHEMLF